MNARNAFNPDLDERAAFPKLKAAHGEDPARFLQSSKDLAFARIRGIRDSELLTAYAAVAKQILSGSEKRDVLEAIDTREHELAGEPADADPTPVPATDGGELLAESRSSSEVSSDVGTVETPDDNGKSSHDLTTTAESEGVTSSPSDSASDSIDDVHLDTEGLTAGEVLVLEHADRTDYIFPATPACETPYLLRAFDGDDERTNEPIGLTYAEVERRTDGESPTPASEVDVRPPTDAATNGGDS